MIRSAIDKIEMRDICFKNTKGEEIFSQVNLTFPHNGVIWIKGQGGAGKSVLIKMICGTITPTAGQFLINEKSIHDMTFEEFLPLRCNMGYSFDFGGLINNRDVVGNLQLACVYHNYYLPGEQSLEKCTETYLDIFGLKAVANERPSAIVGTLRKAVSVARAFVHDPQILLLDDPTTGLRNETKMILSELILKKLKQGTLKQVFVATDDENFMKTLNSIQIEIKNKKLQVFAESIAA